jgi:hypothetical protein
MPCEERGAMRIDASDAALRPATIVAMLAAMMLLGFSFGYFLL